METHTEKEYKIYTADEDAEYDEVIEMSTLAGTTDSGISASSGQCKDDR